MRDYLSSRFKRAFSSPTRVKGVYAILDKGVVGLFGVVFGVLIIRQLPREEFGAFLLSESFRVILVSSVDVAVGQAIIKYISERHDADTPAILFNSLVFKAVLWAASTVALVMLSFFASDWFGGAAVGELLRLLPILMVSMLLNNQPKQYLTARMNIGRVFALDLSLFAIFLIGFYIFREWLVTAKSVILLLSAVYLVNSVQGWVHIFGKVSLSSRVDPEWMRKIYFFSKHALLNNVGMNVYNQSSPVIIGLLMDATAVAVFGAAMVFMQFFYMMGEAFNMIVFPLTSKESRGGKGFAKAAEIYEKYLSYMLVIFFPASVVLVAFPGTLLDLLYAGKYNGTEAVTVLRLIGLWGLLAPFVRLLASVVNGMERPDLLAMTVVISALANIALNFALIPLWGVTGSGVALFASIVVMFITIHLLTSTLIKVSYLRPVAGALRLCVSFFGPRKEI
ncbi:MAG: hypothetical protein A2X99_02635 [Deltaproteobacteria bacterium GWB2_55_19]|nr:MAG: hypothetical protein A2X99_02635 [Deltaproteobacteria bacterium GWB2_55_19]HAO93199.1 hypothetical protein [Deltaproteobacteria bacterium]